MKEAFTRRDLNRLCSFLDLSWKMDNDGQVIIYTGRRFKKEYEDLDDELIPLNHPRRSDIYCRSFQGRTMKNEIAWWVGWTVPVGSPKKHCDGMLSWKTGTGLRCHSEVDYFDADAFAAIVFAENEHLAMKKVAGCYSGIKVEIRWDPQPMGDFVSDRFPGGKEFLLTERKKRKG